MRNKTDLFRTNGNSKSIDESFKKVSKQMLNAAVENKKMKPILDKQLKEVEKIDNKIKWFENKIKEEEERKEKELRKMNDLLELAVKSTHKLSNGYTVKPDDKREFTVEDIGSFLKWLKANKSPIEVMEFLKTSMKKTALRSFCNEEANKQRIEGIIEPKIDGIILGQVTYRRLTTCISKEKKK